MSLTKLLSAIAILGPVGLAWVGWVLGRRSVRPGWVALGFLLGALAILPVVRLANALDPLVGSWSGHFYVDGLIRELLTTALPEEWAKGGVAVLLWCGIGRPMNPLAWLICAVSVHGGFAAGEGWLGALGSEGVLKVVVGRSLGATLHCSWGIIAAGLAWTAGRPGNRRLVRGGLALFLPGLLHAVGNAAQMEIPGAAATAVVDGAAPAATELAVVGSGMLSLLGSWAGAGWFLFGVRRAGSPPPLIRELVSGPDSA